MENLFRLLFGGSTPHDLSSDSGEGGTHLLRHTGMCCPNRLLFHQKSLDMGPILVKKSLEEGPISQKLQKKMVKSVILEAKTL